MGGLLWSRGDESNALNGENMNPPKDPFPLTDINQFTTILLDNIFGPDMSDRVT